MKDNSLVEEALDDLIKERLEPIKENENGMQETKEVES